MTVMTFFSILPPEAMHTTLVERVVIKANLFYSKSNQFISENKIKNF